jgi:mRNA interferase RelE/StbE
MYGLQITRRAQKDLSRLSPKIHAQVARVIDSLADDSRAGHKPLKGVYVPAWRARSGDFRIVYFIDDDDRVVTITRVRDRKDMHY